MAKAAYMIAGPGNTIFPEGTKLGVIIQCPACGHAHVPRTADANDTYPGAQPGPVWTFNGDMDKPTFSPSLLVTWGPPENPRKNICHSFVTDGKIQFLTDCTHSLAGQTVDLPDL